MRLFAISDLHLSLGVDKPMDVFGPQWVGHGDRIREAWDEMVGPDDWVFVGGDTSWGLTLDQALTKYLEAGHDFAIVARDGHFVGLLTMEDILEVIIQREILDDDDFVPQGAD